MNREVNGYQSECRNLLGNIYSLSNESFDFYHHNKDSRHEIIVLVCHNGSSLTFNKKQKFFFYIRERSINIKYTDGQSQMSP